MTNHSARKRSIRALAAKEGISYTEALRRLEANERGRSEQPPPDSPDYLTNLAPETRERVRALMDSAQTPEERARYEALFTAVSQATQQALAEDPEGPDLAIRAGMASGLRGYLATLPLPDADRAQMLGLLDAEEVPGSEAILAVLAAISAATGKSTTTIRDEIAAMVARRTQAQASLLGEIMREPTPAAPLTGAVWTVRFEPHADLSLPYPLRVTDGGLITEQSFWRGEKFQVIGFARTPEAGRLDLRWPRPDLDPIGKKIEDPEGWTEQAVGMYPVIADADGNWALWREKVSAIEFGVEPDHAIGQRLAVHATFVPVDDDPDGPTFQFRCEEFLPALTDTELARLSEADWIADARISGFLYRAALTRRDPHAVAASDWVDDHAREDQDGPGGEPVADEPFRIDLDEEDVARWMDAVRLYPSPRDQKAHR